MGWSDTMDGGSIDLSRAMDAGQAISYVDNVPGGGTYNFELGVADKDALDAKLYINGVKQNVSVGDGDKDQNTIQLPSGETEIKWEIAAKPDTVSPEFYLNINRYNGPDYEVFDESLTDMNFDESWSGPLLTYGTITLDEHLNPVFEASKETDFGEYEYYDMSSAFSYPVDKNAYDVAVFTEGGLQVAYTSGGTIYYPDDGDEIPSVIDGIVVYMEIYPH